MEVFCSFPLTVLDLKLWSFTYFTLIYAQVEDRDLISAFYILLSSFIEEALFLLPLMIFFGIYKNSGDCSCKDLLLDPLFYPVGLYDCGYSAIRLCNCSFTMHWPLWRLPITISLRIALSV